MSACDETQKLKLKNTLSSPSSYAATSAPPRERYRSNFASRNAPVKPTPQQYSAVPYHANNSSKSQKSTYPFYQPNHPNDMMMRHVSRSFSSDANTFSSKNNSNFNNNLSALSNTTNISSKRLDDNRPHYPNTQEKLSKWHSNNKKPPYGKKKSPRKAKQTRNTMKKLSDNISGSRAYRRSFTRAGPDESSSRCKVLWRRQATITASKSKEALHWSDYIRGLT